MALHRIAPAHGLVARGAPRVLAIREMGLHVAVPVAEVREGDRGCGAGEVEAEEVGAAGDGEARAFGSALRVE